MQASFGQLLVGLINGSFYALLSLGLAIIFGLLNVVNFAHGALYMTGAFVAWMGLQLPGHRLLGALLLSPLAVGLLGVVIERTMLRRLYQLDHLYGLLLTFGLTLIIEGLFHHAVRQLRELLPGARGAPGRVQPRASCSCPGTGPGWWWSRWRSASAAGSSSSGPGWAPTCAPAPRTPGCCRPSASTCPLMLTLTYGFGVALAGVRRRHGRAHLPGEPGRWARTLIIVVFAVVVIGGMGSILGSIVTGLGLGLVEGLTKYLYPPAASTVVFVIMAVVLLVRPAGLFGRQK